MKTSLRHCSNNGTTTCNRWFALFFTLMFSCLSTESAFSQVQLVSDIGQMSEMTNGYYLEMVSHNGKVYTVVETVGPTSPNKELWVSDGTFEGTFRLRNFVSISRLTVSGQTLYFSGNEEEPECMGDDPPCAFEDTGTELWKTDGTVQGTVRVKDIYPGPNGSNPRYLVNLNGTLLFVANNGTNGNELWRSDGTASGTSLVKDIIKLGGNGNPTSLCVLGSYVYFSANDGINGYELWRSNGTSAGTTLSANIATASKASSSPQQLVNAGGTLYFIANDQINGKQLWKSNGSINNAALVKVIRPGGNNLINQLTGVGNLVFFEAHDGTHGLELWRSNGTAAGTFMAKDMTTGPGSTSGYGAAHITDMYAVYGKLYFVGFGNDPYRRLWVSDGTSAGTFSLTEQSDVGFTWGSHMIRPFKGEAYFAGLAAEEIGYDFFYKTDLWKTDGTVAGTVKVKSNVSDYEAGGFLSVPTPTHLYFMGYGAIWKSDGTPGGTELIRGFVPVASSSPAHLTDVDGTLFFEAAAPYSQRTLLKSNGTHETTQRLIGNTNSATELTNINGTLYFTANEEPWKSNGTLEGTELIEDISPTMGSNPSMYTLMNGLTYFSASASGAPLNLWKTDGTNVGTTLVKDPSGFINPRELITVGNKLFFLASNASVGEELWVTNGTPAGTMLVKDINAGAASSGATHFTVFNGILYFHADDGKMGYEPWRSDGTPAGTYRIKNLKYNDVGNPTPLDLGNMVATQNALYFTGMVQDTRNGLFKSDGTAAGTVAIKLFNGLPKAEIVSTIDNQVVFTLGFGSYLEVWISDGTTIGTVKIKTITGMTSLLEPYEVTKLGNVIYFLATNGSESQIWRTNGSAAGTYRIAFDGIPYELEASGGLVYLGAYTERWGNELYKINDAITIQAVSLEAAVETNLSLEGDVITAYPNPFTTEFLVRVNNVNNGNTDFALKILTVDGRIIDSHQRLACDTDHYLGNSWPSGMYLVQIMKDNQPVTKRIVKR
jgi:ELWxxDGT repeat protein